MLEDVFAECVRKLEPGGRIAINVANLGRKPDPSLSSDVITILQDKLHLLLRGEVIWQKTRGPAILRVGLLSTTTNPGLSDLTERVVIVSKDRFDRALNAREREQEETSIKGILISGRVHGGHDRRLGDTARERNTRRVIPAPFPVALPARLIHLYTYYDDLVLDPFVGFRSRPPVAAVRTGRHYAGDRHRRCRTSQRARQSRRAGEKVRRARHEPR